MRKVCLCAVFTFLVGVAALPSRGGVIVTDDNADWDRVSAIGQPLNTTIVGGQPDGNVHNSGQAGVELTSGATTVSPRWDFVYENSNLAINLTSFPTENGLYGVEFDFYIGDLSYMPSELMLYFQTATDSFRWYYDLTLPSSSGWSHYTVLISPQTYGSWQSLDTFNSFGTSIGNGFLQAGLGILYDENMDAGNFGLGNFEYHDSGSYYIPEPGTYMMLSTALMSLGYTFARRRREQKKVA